MRIIARDLAGMLTRLERAAKGTRAIPQHAHLELVHGSATNGNAYQIWTASATEREAMTFGTFHFGFTARNAFDRMHGMCVALETSRETDEARARDMLLAGIRCADEVSNGDHTLILRFDRPTERDLLRSMVDTERGRTRS